MRCAPGIPVHQVAFQREGSTVRIGVDCGLSAFSSGAAGSRIWLLCPQGNATFTCLQSQVRPRLGPSSLKVSFFGTRSHESHGRNGDASRLGDGPGHAPAQPGTWVDQISQSRSSLRLRASETPQAQAQEFCWNAIGDMMGSAFSSSFPSSCPKILHEQNLPGVSAKICPRFKANVRSVPCAVPQQPDLEMCARSAFACSVSPAMPARPRARTAMRFTRMLGTSGGHLLALSDTLRHAHHLGSVSALRATCCEARPTSEGIRVFEMQAQAAHAVQAMRSPAPRSHLSKAQPHAFQQVC